MDLRSGLLSTMYETDRGLMDAAVQAYATGQLPARPAPRGRLAMQTEATASGQGAGLPPIETLAPAMAEAIILPVVRPPLLVKEGTWVPLLPSETIPEVAAVIAALKRDKIDPAIATTGRVEFANVPGKAFVGTGWVIRKLADDRAIVVTNRHVAEEFAYPDRRGGYATRLLPTYDEFQVGVDFLCEWGNPAKRHAPLVKVLFIAGRRTADMALLEIEGDELRGIVPIPLSQGDPVAETPIGVVGYPALDSRNDAVQMFEYYRNIYNVKRFAFGYVTQGLQGRPYFLHDATTLGGNSGSLVFNRDTGDAVGLHFAGEPNTANYAVPVSEVEAALAGIAPTQVAGFALSERAETVTPAQTFAGRDGYRPDFLDIALPPPAPGPVWESDLSFATDADSGLPTQELRYRHFSVWMCKSRFLPLITAVNIDGLRSKQVGRTDDWRLDGRLPATDQIDNAGYKSNPLDRGHMVRREDPVWGDTVEEAQEANLDTFHYTNAAPQHEALNQKDWLGLEDFVLSAARNHRLRVSVFTGPVFGDDDPLYRKIVRIPQAFWKIVALVDDDTGALSVTGYVLGQGDLIKGITGEFVYGAFLTYQVEVAQVGALARIDVGHMTAHDPLTRLAAESPRIRMIGGPEDLTL